MTIHAGETSDEVIVLVKRPRNGGVLLAEAVEGRASPKGNNLPVATVRTQSRAAVSPELAALRRADRHERVRMYGLPRHATTTPKPLREVMIITKVNSNIPCRLPLASKFHHHPLMTLANPTPTQFRLDPA